MAGGSDIALNVKVISMEFLNGKENPIPPSVLGGNTVFYQLL